MLTLVNNSFQQAIVLLFLSVLLLFVLSALLWQVQCDVIYMLMHPNELVANVSSYVNFYSNKVKVMDIIVTE